MAACRWTVIFHPETKENDETKVALANDTQVADTNEDKTQMFVMNNYMGFGIDAELSLDFHNARQKNPGKFISRYELSQIIVCRIKVLSEIIECLKSFYISVLNYQFMLVNWQSHTCSSYKMKGFPLL